MISRCFARIGGMRRAIEGRRGQVWFLWFLGAALFAHLVSFFGVNYFDQSKVNWFLLLAMISVATAPIVQKTALQRPETTAKLGLATESLSPSEASGMPV